MEDIEKYCLSGAAARTGKLSKNSKNNYYKKVRS